MPLKKTLKKINKIYKQAKKAQETWSKKRAEKDHLQIETKDHKHEKHEKVLVEFSLSSVAKATILVLLLVYLGDFIVYIQEPLYIFAVSLFMAAIFYPLVDSLEDKGINRGIGIIIVYIMVFGIIAIILLSLVPVLFTQISEIASNIGQYINGFLKTGDYPFSTYLTPFVDQLSNFVEKEQIITTIQDTLKTVASSLGNFATNTFGAIVGVFNDIVNFVFVLVVTFFIVIDKGGIKKFFLSLFPRKHANYLSNKIYLIQVKFGEWVRGQLLLSVSIGGTTFIGLAILGVPYALTLSLLAAVTELIPYLGPIIAYIAVVPIALNESPWLLLWVTILYIIIQQLENNVLVPLIMKSAVGLSPIAVLFAMLIGAKLFGVIGIIAAVPVAATLAIFIQDFADRNNEN